VPAQSSKEAQRALSRKSFLAAHILRSHIDNHRVCPVVEFHARHHGRRLVVDIVVHADLFIPKIGDTGTARCATFILDLALNRVVGEVTIFVSIWRRNVFAEALFRAPDTGDIPNGALQFWGSGASGCLGYRGRTGGRDNHCECRCTKESHGANYRFG
jgi:hypothetical protein